MNRSFYLLILLAFAQTLSAQTLKNQTEIHNDLVSQLLRKQMVNSRMAKTTTAKERLVATSYYQPGPGYYILFDSIALNYGSSARGSAFNFNNMSYEYSASAAWEYSPTISYSTVPMQMMVNADTMRDHSFGYVWHATYFTYDAANRPITKNDYNNDTGKSGIGSQLFYDSAGRPSAIVYFADTVGSPFTDSVNYRAFAYNGLGQLSADSTISRSAGLWKYYIKYEYSYSGSSDISKVVTYKANTVGTNWDLYSTTNINYMGGQVQTVITDTGSMHALYVKDSFSYSGTSFHTYAIQYVMKTSGWDTSQLITKTLNSAMLPGTVKTIVKTTFKMLYTQYFTYDSYGQPIFMHDSSGVFSPPRSPSSSTYFYYEPYESDNITKILPGTEAIHLYPNPAKNELHVQWDASLQNGKLQFYISNSLGQLVYNSSTSGNAGKAMILVRDQLPGLYFISVKNEAGETIATDKFIKE